MLISKPEELATPFDVQLDAHAKERFITSS